MKVDQSIFMHPRHDYSEEEIARIRRVMLRFKSTPSFGILSLAILFRSIEACGFAKGQFYFIISNTACLAEISALRFPFYYTRRTDGWFMLYIRPKDILSMILRSMHQNPYEYDATQKEISRWQDKAADSQDH